MGININVSEYFIVWYAAVTTMIIIIMVIVKISSRRKAAHWKRTVLNVKLGFIGGSQEWERNDNVILRELLEENERLGIELSLLRRENRKLSIAAVMIFMVLKFSEILKLFEKKEKDNTDKIR